MRSLLCSLGLGALALLAPGPGLAQASNGGACVAIHTTGIRAAFFTVPQPDSGALVLFQDTRNGTGDVYSQRVDRRGRPLNGPGGTLVWAMPPNEFVDAYIADGSGGVILVRSENRGVTGKDVVLKRVLSDGTQSYGANGIVICTVARDQIYPKLVLGTGGFYYVVWNDDRLDPDYNQDIYAQRVSLAGAPQWAANGVRVNSATYNMWGANMDDALADMSGGLIVLWDPNTPTSTRAQRLNSAGTLQWTANGVQFGDVGDRLRNFGADGTGGVWGVNSEWDGTYTRFYAHRLLSTGAAALPLAGVEFHSGVYQGGASLAVFRTGTGGAMFFVMPWYQSTSLSRPLHRQELSATGTVLRGTDGDQLGYFTAFPELVDVGTALLMGFQEQVALGQMSKLRVQRYAFDGTAFYSGLGVVVGRDEPNRLIYPPAMSMAANGVIATAWADGRYSSPSNNYNVQVFGQAITPLGASLWDDSELPAIQTVRDAAADQGGYVRVTWNASIADHPGARSAKGYRVWRALPDAAAASLAGARPAKEGMFRLGGRDLLFQANSFWEVAGDQVAATLAQYAKTATTMQDSMAGVPADQSFMVEAYDDSSHHWFSSALTGHSVDNLAPALPPFANGLYTGSQTMLDWGEVTDADLCCYEVFRGSSPGFVPSDANRIATTTDRTAVDPAGSPYFYRIAARDVHGNRGPSALVMPHGTTDVDGTAPRAWRLRSTWRAGALELALELPEADEGRLELFDVTGRRLWSAPYRAEAARSLEFRVAGAVRLPAGMVYARALSATGRQLRAKAVVLR